MNCIYDLLSAVANGLQALWRAVTGLHEERPDPYYLSRYAGWSGPYEHMNEPARTDEQVAAAWAFPAPVSLVKAPPLVRPFVGQLAGPARPATVDLAQRVVSARRAVGRAVVVACDELGLPSGMRLSNDETPGVGIFEQVLEAWKRTGRRDVSWA